MQKFALSVVLLCSGIAAARELVSGKDPRHKRSLNYQHTEIPESKSELESERYKKRRSKESAAELASGKESAAELASGKESAAELASGKESAAELPDVFYDAAKSYFKQDGTRQVFSGDVVVIGGGYVITADDISIDRQAGVLEAKGNVLVAGEEQALSASTVRYWFATRDFVVTDAQLIISDRAASTRLREQILARGTDKEVHHARRQRLWLQTRHAGEQGQSYYLKFRSQRITRRQLDFLQADEAFLTPCRCVGDEPPAFALRARRIDAVIDEHIDFNTAVVEVRGWPVFFLPFLRLPLARKSGLLLPVFGHRKQTGFSISQPFYVAFNAQADATFYLDWLQRRGLRLAASSRGRLSEQHHWQLIAEGLHDRNAAHDDAPQWRGTLKWHHLRFLTPRLSFGSEGELSRDAAYNRALYRMRRGEAQFDLNPYAARRLWLHLDHPDFYAGFSGHLAGDSEYFSGGEQLPANFTLQSRHLQLLDLSAFKTWAHLHLQQQHIGAWQQLSPHQQARLRAVNVLVGTALDVEQFWEVEAQRLVDRQRNHQHTWRAGLRVSLPLDGRMSLPTHEEQTRMLQHLVRFNAGIVVQPQVWTTGSFQPPPAQEHSFTANQQRAFWHAAQPSEVLELELEQAWRVITQSLPRVELAGPRRDQHVPQHTQTPLSLRVSTMWDRRQAERRAAAKQRGDDVLPQAWSPLQLDLRLQHGDLSLRQELAWNVYRHEFDELRLTLGLPVGDGVQLKPSWEIMPHVLDASASAQPRVQVRRLGVVAQLARQAELQAEYADRVPLDDSGPWQYRWQIGGEYRGQQQCWGLAFSRVKDWNDRESEASYMLSLQVNFVNSPYYDEES